MQVQPAPPRARKPRKAKRPSGLFSKLGLSRWPRRRIVLTGVIAIAATGIAVNALVLQSARHPAPLFAAVEQARIDAARKAAAAARVAAERPLPPARPQQEVAALTPPAPVAAPAPQSAAQVQSQQAAQPQTEQQSLARLMSDVSDKPARATPDKPAKPAAPEKNANAEKPAAKPATPATAKGDALAELIRGGIVPPGGVPSEPDPKIQQVQRYLVRQGAASVKPDGFMGPATRAAIEKYERDHKWQVTGEISPKLLRESGTVAASRP
ncbi:peptidoglycan-binding domain-containing protein [Terrarubrum flagellatum]|uniref:peptidoglycan-binding domain-containing protein n=1 Tax=Terrirubrum flagellatum TaxID=2895980 RepID=UPI00314540F6